MGSAFFQLSRCNKSPEEKWKKRKSQKEEAEEEEEEYLKTHKTAGAERQDPRGHVRLSLRGATGGPSPLSSFFFSFLGC
jgi:DNA repair exonuclease SbcCD nuclease subunit